MQYFMETVDTIERGVGFSHFDSLHICWLAAFLLICAVNCVWYHKLGEGGRRRWKKLIALLLLADELFKIVILLIGGNYGWDYMPFHLCSINMFLIAFHAWKPNKLLGNFLYTICIPGTVAALLFPAWTKLPLLNAMHIHSFTVHILLALYPIVLAVNGELKPSARMIPKCLMLLLAMAAVVYGLNLLLDTNFMFLMYANKGNPLYWFEKNWGCHLWGFPVIAAGVLTAMYVPLEAFRKIRKHKYA